MEIDDSFSSPEEIMDILSKEGLTFKIGFDDEDFDDDDLTDSDFETNSENQSECFTSNSLSNALFSVEMSPEELNRLELILEDAEDDSEEFDERECAAGEEQEHEQSFIQKSESDADKFRKEFKDADIIYFDLFKSKRYVKTLIFQRENDRGRNTYCLVGDCEAPMCFGK
ncbi:hypothetical protein [Methanolapillus millepedarum]|uniref:Uncharacterized protein n=1 Tax=Methanolapillus millepedarum TaxID=3028296 RepID=A0AA96V4H0_9EURY|nr:hypothetical protein MsAc7_09150 [Methanosarcinaceae archaeon Ac7]